MTTQPGGATNAPDAPQRSVRSALVRKPVAVLLVLVMAVGSVVLWIGIPVAWIWGVSQTVDTTQPQFGPYLAILVGVPVTMYVFGRFLWKTNQTYERITGQPPEVRVQLPWHRSMRGERAAGRRTTVLDAVMISSVGLALLVFAIWFFLFAGSSLPRG